jgi:hypothetical protein
MVDELSLDGRTLVAVANEGGEVSADTRFHFEQDGDRIHAEYEGGTIVEGHLVGTFTDGCWDVRYVQLHADGETATGRSVGEVTILDDGRVRVADDWEWESKEGGGSSVLEEVE